MYAQDRYKLQLDTLTLVAALDSVMQPFDNLKNPGAVVGVIKGGEVAWSDCYGAANLTDGVPNTRRTLFNLASVSKQFASLFFAMQAEAGKLSLDDDVRKYMPELPDFGDTVTLRHLLNHTSGYREAYGPLGLQGRRATGDVLLRRDAWEIVQRQPYLQWSPGTRHLYNSTGYVILTEIAERISGQSYPYWMEENVFGPLGMDHTVIEREAGQVIPRAAVSYTRMEDDTTWREDYEAYNYYGSTDLYTTLGDLAKWMGNLQNSQVGGPGVIDRLTERTILPDGDTLAYAPGLIVEDYRSYRMWSHTGATGGYRIFFHYWPERDLGLVIMANSGSVPWWAVRDIMLNTLFPTDGISPEIPSSGPAVPISQPMIDRYAGAVYTGDGVSFLRIDTTAGRLGLYQYGNRTVLEAINDTTFRSGEANYLHLGKVAPYQHNYGVGKVSLRRVAPISAPTNLQQYTGAYFSEEAEAHYTLSVQDDQLEMYHRVIGSVVLQPLGQDVYLAQGMDAVFRFNRNRDSAVTGFTVDTGHSFAEAV